MTPFAPRAIDRGLTALLVSCIRQMGVEFNENAKAGRIDRRHPFVRAAVEEIVRRAHLVGAGAAIEDLVRAELEKRLDEWLARAQQMSGGQRLGYRDARDGLTVLLLRRAGRDSWTDFTCLNSLRDVEPEVGLVLDDRGSMMSPLRFLSSRRAPIRSRRRERSAGAPPRRRASPQPDPPHLRDRVRDRPPQPVRDGDGAQRLGSELQRRDPRTPASGGCPEALG